MRTSISCCLATTALLALTLSAHASPGIAMTGAAGLHSAIGAGPVTLVAGENDVKTKKVRRARSGGQKQQMMQQMMQQVPAEYQQYVPQGMGGGGMSGGGMGGGGMGAGGMGGGIKY